MGNNPRPAEIPDHVSTTPGDEHYFKWWPKIGVKLNGQVISNCAEFCVSEGWVKLYVRGPRGKFVSEQGRLRTVFKPKVVVEPYWR